MSENTDVKSRRESRALRYLRWFPSTWRLRYGEEFAAHLEMELEERPLSLRRGANIVLHGVSTRFQVQRGLRWTAGIGAGLALAASMTLAVIAAESIPPALALAGTDTTSVGMQTNTTKVNSFTFTFRAPAGKEIRVVRVTALVVPGTAVPTIVAVDFSNRFVNDVNPGWPATIAKGTYSGSSAPRLVNALGAQVTLGAKDSLVVAFRTPLARRLYGVGGIVVSYIHGGHRYEFLLRSSLAQTLCTVPLRGQFSSEWCDAKMAAADAAESIVHPLTSEESWSRDQHVASWLYGDVAAFGLERDERMTLGQMRYFASVMAPVTNHLGIRRVTLSHNGVFHIFFRGAQGETTQICYRRDVVNTAKHYSAMSSQGSCSTGLNYPAGPVVAS